MKATNNVNVDNYVEQFIKTSKIHKNIFKEKLFAKLDRCIKDIHKCVKIVQVYNNIDEDDKKNFTENHNKYMTRSKTKEVVKYKYRKALNPFIIFCNEYKGKNKRAYWKELKQNYKDSLIGLFYDSEKLKEYIVYLNKSDYIKKASLDCYIPPHVRGEA